MPPRFLCCGCSGNDGGGQAVSMLKSCRACRCRSDRNRSCSHERPVNAVHRLAFATRRRRCESAPMAAMAARSALVASPGRKTCGCGSGSPGSGRRAASASIGDGRLPPDLDHAGQLHWPTPNLSSPANCETLDSGPTGRSRAEGFPVTAEIDFRQTGPQTEYRHRDHRWFRAPLARRQYRLKSTASNVTMAVR